MPLRFTMYLYSILGLAIGLGTLWDVFGWANLSTLSLLVLGLLNVLNRHRFPSSWPVKSVRFLWISWLIVAMVCLSALQVVWSHPDFGPPTVTNQEWIRTFALAGGLTSMLLTSDQIRKPLFIGIALGFACYGFGSVILSYVFGLNVLSPFDMHFGGVWGTPANPTPPGIAVFGATAIILITLARLIKAFPIVGLSVSLCAFFAIVALDRRSTLLPILLYVGYFTAPVFRSLWRVSSGDTLNKKLSKILTSFGLSAIFVVLFDSLSRTRLSVRISSALSEGLASAEFDRIDHYRIGYSRLLESLLTGNNYLINLPPQLRASNPHWHSSPLDALRIGGFLGFACLVVWYLSLLFVLFFRSSTPVIRVSALGVLLIMSVEPTMYKTWYDVLVPQLLTYFMVAETISTLKPALPE